MRHLRSTILFLSALLAPSLSGQTLEPRLYSNAPVGMNFLIAGYAYSEGAPSINPEAGLDDPHLSIDTAILAYARFFDLFGQSAKIDAVLPGVCLDGYAYSDGERLTRKVCGAGDLKARIAWNVFGAPALSKQAFSGYSPDTVIGISLQVTAPTGQYDESKLVNIGANRWAFKPSIGLSKTLGSFVAELSSQLEVYTDNTRFYNGHTRHQDPILSVQTHLIYNIRPGMWGALDATYYWGGETSTDGIANGDAFDNSRIGATFAFPVNRTNAVKLYGSNGVITRAGSNFTLFGVAWQYRWGGD